MCTSLEVPIPDTHLRGAEWSIVRTHCSSFGIPGKADQEVHKHFPKSEPGTADLGSDVRLGHGREVGRGYP